MNKIIISNNIQAASFLKYNFYQFKINFNVFELFRFQNNFFIIIKINFKKKAELKSRKLENLYINKWDIQKII